jgi:hypothetical protein
MPSRPFGTQTMLSQQVREVSHVWDSVTHIAPPGPAGRSPPGGTGASAWNVIGVLQPPSSRKSAAVIANLDMVTPLDRDA